MMGDLEFCWTLDKTLTYRSRSSKGSGGVSSGDLHLLKAPSIIKHQAMIKARSRQRHRLLVISGTAVQPYRYSSALHARGGRG